MKMKTFIYLLIQTLVLGMWPWSSKDYVCLWNDCNNDICFCVLHLKLWMLALIQGLALQSQGSFFLYKGGILQQSFEAPPLNPNGQSKIWVRTTESLQSGNLQELFAHGSSPAKP